ncbi:MAG: succinylglutamate desuccinylase [Desulfuromonas sp.]|nr:MAG: succinylglutamate desuccinylase [Desulfuromonas sp.]
MQQPLSISGITIKPGQRTTVDLPVAKLYTHTDITLSAHIIHGRQPGPCLFITSAVHGDELNGVEIIRRLLKRKSLTHLKGTLIALPVVNSFGFIHRDRYLPDRRDLNRAFPGSERGSLASRIADLLSREILPHCSHGIDLHTGANHRFNLPKIRACLDDETTRELAEVFGAPVIIHSRLRDGSLREAVAEKNIPMLLYEAGEAFRFDELSIRTGLRGIQSVMREIGMLPQRRTHKLPAVFRAETSKWIRAPISGMVIHKIAIGKQVKKGDLLGIISDPFGDNEQRLTAPFSGLVIGRLEMPLVYEGDALFHVAMLAGELPGDQILDDLVSELGQDDFWPRLS